jgi:regulator of replication initiation timing
MYEQTYKRLEKLKTTFDHLVINNQELQKELKSLRQYVETAQAREEARERVLITLSKEKNNLDWLKYVKEIHLAPQADLGLIGQVEEEIKEDRKGVSPPT